METRPFDPAEYLDSEEAIAAYLADARRHGVQELSDATEVVVRARALNGKGRVASKAAHAQREAGVTENTAGAFHRDGDED